MPLAVKESRQTFPEDQRSLLTLTQRKASCAARSAWSSPGRPAGMGLRAVGSSAWVIARVAAAKVRESRAGGRRSASLGRWTDHFGRMREGLRRLSEGFGQLPGSFGQLPRKGCRLPESPIR